MEIIIKLIYDFLMKKLKFNKKIMVKFYKKVKKVKLEFVMKENINSLKQYVKAYTKGETTGHDWWHIERVYNNAISIAIEEKNCKKYLVEIISLMHDLCDHKFFKGNIEEEIKRILILSNLYKNLEKNEIANIIDSCKNLGFSSNIECKKKLSIEGQIVQDADRLDSIGAIGIARTFTYGGAIKRSIYNPDIGIIEIHNQEEYNNLKRHSINHFYEKLLKVPKLMNTKKGKELAKVRNGFMENYLKEFFEEWKGIK